VREGEEQRFVPGAGDLEEDSALLLEADLPVVQGAGEAGHPEVVDQLLDRHAAVLLLGRLWGEGHASLPVRISRTWLSAAILRSASVSAAFAVVTPPAWARR